MFLHPSLSSLWWICFRLWVSFGIVSLLLFVGGVCHFIQLNTSHEWLSRKGQAVSGEEDIKKARLCLLRGMVHLSIDREGWCHEILWDGVCGGGGGKGDGKGTPIVPTIPIVVVVVISIVVIVVHVVVYSYFQLSLCLSLE
ncbi:hypothetical protein Tco_0505756 [Tanacetum coccineum]